MPPRELLESGNRGPVVVGGDGGFGGGARPRDRGRRWPSLLRYSGSRALRHATAAALSEDGDKFTGQQVAWHAHSSYSVAVIVYACNLQILACTIANQGTIRRYTYANS